MSLRFFAVVIDADGDHIIHCQWIKGYRKHTKEDDLHDLEE